MSLSANRLRPMRGAQLEGRRGPFRSGELNEWPQIDDGNDSAAQDSEKEEDEE